jgi:hypothetical protein
MTEVKPDISLSEPLLERVEALAQEMRISLNRFWIDLGNPLDKSQLDEYIGTLSPKRIRQILDGIRLITEPRDVE